MNVKQFKNWAGCLGLAAGVLSVGAQNESPRPAAVVVTNDVARMPYGVADVVRLAHAGVGEDTIVAFVQNKNSQYGLGASEILYLKDQGVSDKVISAMLQNGKSAPPAQSYNYPAQANYATQSSAASQVVQPVQTYVQSVPTTAASSTYVIPSTDYQPTYVYPDNYYPDYGWSGYYYPPVVLGFGFGGRGFYHGGFYHGGAFRGGFHSGAGFGGGVRRGSGFGSGGFGFHGGHR